MNPKKLNSEIQNALKLVKILISYSSICLQIFYGLCVCINCSARNSADKRAFVRRLRSRCRTGWKFEEGRVKEKGA